MELNNTELNKTQNNQKLEKFSLEHFTFINQFFGDQTVREVIAQVFPNKRYRFMIENFDNNSHHHILYDVRKKTKVCSVENGDQTIAIDKNDMLCQSYSLLTFFSQPIKRDKRRRQMDMITMYKVILESKEFRKVLESTIDIPNPAWRDYRKEGAPQFEITKKTFYTNIKRVLEHWQEYGYWYFIGDGIQN
jgi:hypothetical protein